MRTSVGYININIHLQQQPGGRGGRKQMGFLPVKIERNVKIHDLYMVKRSGFLAARVDRRTSTHCPFLDLVHSKPSLAA
jgi:hypothetical protein